MFGSDGDREEAKNAARIFRGRKLLRSIKHVRNTILIARAWGEGASPFSRNASVNQSFNSPERRWRTLRRDLRCRSPQ